MSEAPDIHVALSIAGGTITLVSAIGLALTFVWPPVGLVVVIGPPLIIMLGAIMMQASPRRHRTWSIVIIASAALTSTQGSMVLLVPLWGVQVLIGAALGIAGGALGLRATLGAMATGEPRRKGSEQPRVPRAGSSLALIGSTLILSYALGLGWLSAYDGVFTDFGIDLFPLLVILGLVSLVGSLLLFADPNRGSIWGLVLVVSCALNLLQLTVRLHPDLIGNRIQALPGIALGIAGGVIAIRWKFRSTGVAPMEQGPEEESYRWKVS